MKSYRLVIRQQGRIVGHFDTTGEAALEDACVARSLFGFGRWISVRTAGR